MNHFVVSFGDVTHVAVFADDEEDARQQMIQAACDRWGGRRDDWEYLAKNATVSYLGKRPVWL